MWKFLRGGTTFIPGGTSIPESRVHTYIHFFTRDKHPFASKIIPPLLGTWVPKFILLDLLCLRIYGSFYMIHDNSIFCDLSSPWLFETTLLALVKMSLSQIRRVHLFESQSCLERILHSFQVHCPPFIDEMYFVFWI